MVPVCDASGNALIKDLYVVEIHLTGNLLPLLLSAWHSDWLRFAHLMVFTLKNKKAARGCTSARRTRRGCAGTLATTASRVAPRCATSSSSD